MLCRIIDLVGVEHLKIKIASTVFASEAIKVGKSPFLAPNRPWPPQIGLNRLEILHGNRSTYRATAHIKILAPALEKKITKNFEKKNPNFSPVFRL